MSKTTFERTAAALLQNLRNALEVAGDGTGSVAEPMSKSDLARRTKLSRDAVANLIPKEDADESGNCDLRTLCAVAEQLGVPPALLLMTPEDWHHFLSALDTLADWEQDPQSRAEFENKLNTLTGVHKVELGLSIAHAQGYRAERIPEGRAISGIALHEHQKRLDRINSVKRRAILVATALAQPGATYSGECFKATAVAAQVAATSKVNLTGDEE
jgi:hypothetical protein